MRQYIIERNYVKIYVNLTSPTSYNNAFVLL